MPRLTPADLQEDLRFRLLDVLEHHNLMPFLQRYYFNLRSPVILLHFLILAAYLLACWLTAVPLAAAGKPWVAQAGLAGLFFLALVPVHEVIHMLAYRLYGARDVRFSVSLHQLYAYAIADGFVIARAEFVWVALAPFLAINAILLIIAVLSPGVRFFALALSAAHYSGTSGDWALLAYVWEHRARPLYTYDDAARRSSYFYEEV